LTRLARAFLAAVPPGPVLDAVDQRLAPLAPRQPGLRWLPRPQWHITLQFLGPVDDAETLADALVAVLGAHPPFRAQLVGGGAFPTTRRATVLWLGVEPADQLADLAATITAATAEPGHAVEPRRYHPHLTVARARQPRPLASVVEALGTGPVGPPWTVDQVTLVESDLRPDGAVHTPWRPLPLGNA